MSRLLSESNHDTGRGLIRLREEATGICLAIVLLMLTSMTWSVGKLKGGAVVRQPHFVIVLASHARMLACGVCWLVPALGGPR